MASENRQRTQLAVARMYPAEYRALKAAAADRGVSVGELIRRALRNELEALSGSK